MLGHIFKILSFYFLYRAIIKNSLKDPYKLIFNRLKSKKEELQIANSKLKKHLQDVLEKGVSRTVEMTSPGGETFLLSGHLIKNHEGEVTSIVEVGYKITERKKVEKKKEEAIKDLEQFAYIASHDLNAPLRAITSFLQLIEQKLEFYWCKNIADSLEYIQEREPDIVLLDLNLPGSRGLDTISKFSDYLFKISFIVLTALDDIQLAEAENTHTKILEMLKDKIDNKNYNLKEHLQRVKMQAEKMRQILEIAEGQK